MVTSCSRSRTHLVKVREHVALNVVARYLRRFDALPDHADKQSHGCVNGWAKTPRLVAR